MLFQVAVNRLTHNYLHRRLEGKPLSLADDICYYLQLMVQSPKNVEHVHKCKFTMRYPVELDDVYSYRTKGELLTDIESKMFCAHVEYFIKGELIRLLDESDDYNETFFQFQEYYCISDLDFSRDNMYKIYERHRKGELLSRFHLEGRSTPALLLQHH